MARGLAGGLLNDRYFDLAVPANFVVTNDADGMGLSRAVFRRTPDGYQRARFFLMRQVLHMFSATIFLVAGIGGQTDKPK